MTPPFYVNCNNHLLQQGSLFYVKKHIAFLWIHSVACLLEKITKKSGGWVFFPFRVLHAHQYLRPNKAVR